MQTGARSEEVRRTDLRVCLSPDEVQRAWGEWFTSAGSHLVDPGSPFGHGVEITRDGRTELTLESPSPLVGYCILNAESLEEAEALVRDMPVTESVRIYESHSM